MKGLLDGLFDEFCIALLILAADSNGFTAMMLLTNGLLVGIEGCCLGGDGDLVVVGGRLVVVTGGLLVVEKDGLLAVVNVGGLRVVLTIGLDVGLVKGLGVALTNGLPAEKLCLGGGTGFGLTGLGVVVLIELAFGLLKFDDVRVKNGLLLILNRLLSTLSLLVLGILTELPPTLLLTFVLDILLLAGNVVRGRPKLFLIPLPVILLLVTTLLLPEFNGRLDETAGLRCMLLFEIL